jgi:excinuclease ABC subunit C
MAVGAELIRERARELPDAPGVYLFQDEAGDVLYVGKAKSLRKRVASYARADRILDRKTLDLVLRVAQVDSLVASSETEALFLEQNLIKRHRPPFNVRLRDDKSYPYIAVTVSDRYPRVVFTRERHRRGVRYFGPYASASKVRETLDVLNRVFPYRPCEGPDPGRRSGIPCLDYHIGRCLAPCVGYVSEAGYREVIDGIVEFLEGRTRPVERRLEREMREAAAEHRFEDAARARNRLQAVQHLRERQLVDRAAVGDVDAFGVARDGELACVLLLPVRDGRLGERYTFVLENAGEAADDDLVEAVVGERYGASGAGVPPLVLVPESLERREELEAALTARRGARVEVRVPERGEKRSLAELAARNAAHGLEGARLDGERTRLRRFGALEELRDALNLEALPLRIECFDISNLGESATVASMVVFEQGVAKKSDYRIFGIGHGQGQDDFASMAEAVRRRFTRLANATSVEGDYDPGFAAVPNLVVIDGGKGQLSAALGALDGLDLPRVAAIGLAKRIEEVFVPGRSDPIMLAPDSPGLLLLRRIRDEAHRFALHHHRKRRARSAGTESIFERLPGVGPARKQALLEHFGAPAAILDASVDELEAVPGLPPRTARAIHAFLHKTGGAGPSRVP